MNKHSKRKVLSVIIPCYNEDRTIEAVIDEISSVNLDNNVDKEIILIDDGSRQSIKDIYPKLGLYAKNGCFTPL